MEDNGLSLDEIYENILNDKELLKQSKIDKIEEENRLKEIHRQHVYESFILLSNASVASPSTSGGSRIDNNVLWANYDIMTWANGNNIQF